MENLNGAVTVLLKGGFFTPGLKPERSLIPDERPGIIALSSLRVQTCVENLSA